MNVSNIPAKTHQVISVKTFVLTCLVVSIWINASEVFRYFVIVMPGLRDTLAVVPDVAPMNIPVFLIWGIWDSILVVMVVFIYSLFIYRFGDSIGISVTAASISWLFFFVLFWLGMWNMNLAPGDLAILALALAWVELVIACLIARWGFQHF